MLNNELFPRNTGIRRLFEKRLNLLIILTLISATIFSYGSSIPNGFVWDDIDIIVNNVMNRELSNIFILFQSADSTLAGNQTMYYRPLSRLTFMIDYKLFGLNPVWYHLENITIHIFAVLLLFLLMERLFNEPLLAFVTSCVFAVHPVNAEAVNFLSTRNTLLSAVFVLSSFIVYMRAGITGKKVYSYLSAVLFFLGLLCKETAFMLIVILLFYDVTSLRDIRQRVKGKVSELWPFAIAVTIYLGIRAYAVSNIVITNLAAETLLPRVLNNVYIIPKYLMAILFPVNLNAHYSVPDHYGTQWIYILFAWTIIVVVMVFLLKMHRAAIRFGLFWFAINFVPISNIIAIPSAPMADRYMYLPAIGLWLIAADLFCVLYARRTHRKAVVSCGVIILICASTITFSRNFVWKDNITFYTEMVKMNPDSELAHYSLGLASMERGDITGAQREWKRTVEINPNYFNVLSLLGQSYLMQNSLAEAEYYYSKALAADPNKAEALYNLAVINEKLLRSREALYYYERFLESPSNQYVNAIEKAREKVQRLRAGDK